MDTKGKEYEESDHFGTWQEEIVTLHKARHTSMDEDDGGNARLDVYGYE